jgi:hypothetical protein
MTPETLTQPLSTPSNVGPQLPTGLDQVARYVSDHRYSENESSRHGSAYDDSPGPGIHHEIPQTAQSLRNSDGEGNMGRDIGLGIHYVRGINPLKGECILTTIGWLWAKCFTVPGRSIQWTACK